MKRVLQGAVVAVLAVEALVLGQGADVNRILGEVRAALGGDKLAAVKSVAIEGRTARVGADGQSQTSDFEMAMELPNKYMKKEAAVSLGSMTLFRRTGFNGDDVIEEMDAPPGMGGGGMRVMSVGPGSGMVPGGKATPEQLEAQRKLSLLNSRREFARLALGMFAQAYPAYPLEFAYAGQAESPDGKADVIEVRGAEGFVAKLFVDGTTRLPLMLSWMDKEPLRMSMGPGGASTGGVSVGGAHMQTFTRSSSGGGATHVTPEEVAKMQQDMAERMKEAEARRRMVEYRMFYGEYKTIDGVKLPTRIQRMMDGLPTDETEFEKIKINSRIDAKKFAVAK